MKAIAFSIRHSAAGRSHDQGGSETSGLHARRSLFCACLLALTTSVQAQSWESVAGFSTRSESYRGTTELRNCTPTGDVLHVGTAGVGSSAPRLLLERRSAVATLGFLAEYDSASRPEQGGKAVEYGDGSGFATVGTLDQTTGDPTSRLIVTKFDCNGFPSWRFHYGPMDGINQGSDIVQTAFGSGPFAVPGDLVALGNFQPNGTAVRRPRLARLNAANGTPRWVRDYPLLSPQGGTWTMAATTEMAPLPGESFARLASVGLQGTVAAALVVNGDTGQPLCAVRVDGMQRAQFHDVVAYKDSTGIGFLAVGQTNASTQPAQQMYLARFDAKCVLKAHVHWGNASDVEIARAADLTRANTFAGAPAGVLMVGGEVNGAYAGLPNSQDAWLSLADPLTLLPYVLPGGVPVVGQRYGAINQGAQGAEKIFSVGAAANGAYLAGSSSSPWVAPDPLAAYGLRALSTGFRTACSVPWRLPATVLPLASIPLGPGVIESFGHEEPRPVRKQIDAQQLCCPLWYGPIP